MSELSRKGWWLGVGMGPTKVHCVGCDGRVYLYSNPNAAAMAPEPRPGDSGWYADAVDSLTVAECLECVGDGVRCYWCRKGKFRMVTPATETGAVIVAWWLTPREFDAGHRIFQCSKCERYAKAGPPRGAK